MQQPFSLFPTSRERGSSPLLQFRAGKCILTQSPGTTKFQVTMDTRRGMITLSKGEDGLLSFKWAASNTPNSPEDERIVFAGESEFKKVNTGREGDRVYMLKFSPTQRYMYWMQDKSNEKDEELVKRVNELILNPDAPAPGQPAVPGAAGAAGQPNMEEFMNLMGLGNAAGGAAGLGLAGLGARTRQPLQVPMPHTHTNPNPPLDLAAILQSISNTTTTGTTTANATNNNNSSSTPQPVTAASTAADTAALPAATTEGTIPPPAATESSQQAADEPPPLVEEDDEGKMEEE
mmetsp:Transcript_6039/g.9028  ORF Transcript_6039/g.9028 Transcript_6039/m.9028 type:complete len:291 (+) Transcript_6039:33-905(+)